MRIPKLLLAVALTTAMASPAAWSFPGFNASRWQGHSSGSSLGNAGTGSITPFANSSASGNALGGGIGNMMRNRFLSRFMPGMSNRPAYYGNGSSLGNMAGAVPYMGSGVSPISGMTGMNPISGLAQMCGGGMGGYGQGGYGQGGYGMGGYGMGGYGQMMGANPYSQGMGNMGYGQSLAANPYSQMANGMNGMGMYGRHHHHHHWS